MRTIITRLPQKIKVADAFTKVVFILNKSVYLHGERILEIHEGNDTDIDTCEKVGIILRRL